MQNSCLNSKVVGSNPRQVKFTFNIQLKSLPYIFRLGFSQITVVDLSLDTVKMGKMKKYKRRHLGNYFRFS